MSQTKTATVRARIDPELKAKAEAVLDEVGFAPGDAIRLFYKHVVRSKGLPFEPKIPAADGGRPAAKTATVRARIDPDLKAKAEAILKRIGLSASGAVRLYYARVILDDGIPLDMHIPNATTRRAMRNLREGKNVTEYETFDDLLKDLGLRK